MPHPIPPEKRLYRILVYICRKQLANRPAILVKLMDSLGMGISRIKAILEEKEVKYLIIDHFGKGYIKSSEIVISYIPEFLYEEIAFYDDGSNLAPTGITAEKIKETYEAMIKHLSENNIPVVGETEIPIEQITDFYYGRRLTDQQYEVMKDDLISRQDLIKVVIEKGYTASFLVKFTNVHKVPYSSFWQQYTKGHKNYFDKEVLKHLDDLEKRYKCFSNIKKVRARARIIELRKKRIANKTYFTN